MFSCCDPNKWHFFMACAFKQSCRKDESGETTVLPWDVVSGGGGGRSRLPQVHQALSEVPN